MYPSWSSWFQYSRKKGTVVVSTLFGMVSRVVQRKILDDNEMQNFKRSKLEMFFGENTTGLAG